jgi:hypothetical protein
MYPFSNLARELYIGVGTHLKYYLLDGGVFFDITPIRATTAAGDVTFSATDGSTTLTVTDTAHGVVLSDFVTFSGAASLGGVVTAAILNQEYQVTSITNTSIYAVELAAAANASDTGDGGASVVGEYQINVGLDTQVLGTGWGADPWSADAWGEAASSAAGTGVLRIWSQDNFGEDLVINPVDGGIYYWDASSGTSSRAASLSDLSGANAAPTLARRVMVSDRDRHIICFGCDGEFSSGVQDSLLIRWCDQENAAEWASLPTNTAGSIALSSGTRIITAVQTKREIIIFTDMAVHSMQYIGPPYTFGVNEIARDAQIIGPGALVADNDVLYWMSNGAFLKYDGVVSEVECSVKACVFSCMNRKEGGKVTAGHNHRFAEIWWFYPSEFSTENDRYVVYNYEQDVWYIGTLARTAWVTTGIISRPLAASPDGYIYEHEYGMNDGSTSPESSIHSYIESSSMDIGDGDSFFFARRVIPDLTFRDSTNTPEATMTFKARNFPGVGFDAEDSGDVIRTVELPLEEYTKQLHIRLRGRTLSMRIESDKIHTEWRLGAPRMDIRTDGKR